MKHNSDYAKMFRSRPARFVLPMKVELRSQESGNLIKLGNTKAQAHCLENGEIEVTPEKIFDVGCETPRINYSNYLGMRNIKI